MSKRLTLLSVIFLLAGCATQIGVRNTADQRLTMFSQIVFAPDYDSRRVEYLAKWVAPLNLEMRDRDTFFVEKYGNRIKQRVKSLGDLTGLPASVVAESQPANVTVFFDTLAGIKQYAQTYARDKAAGSNIDSTGCHSEIDRNAKHEIVGARIFVRAEREVTGMLSTSNNVAKEANLANNHRVDNCLALEIFRILGLRNFSDILAPSVFNSTRNVNQATVLDLKFIRTLYQPELKPGMPRKDALQVADRFLQK